jgi:ribosomal-protein-alanine N-acetyltransferase
VNDRLEVGYILGRSYWRQGLATEALRAFLGHCFGPLQVHRVEATIDVDNLPSIRLAERLGFRCESGPMRKRLKMPDGRFANILMFGLLASDHAPRSARQERNG